MHWDDLFAELTAQFDAVHLAARDEEVAEMARAEAASVTLTDRIRARMGQEVRFRLVGGEDRRGRLERAEQGWFVLADGPRRSLIPSGAIAQAWPLAGVAPPPPTRRLPFGHALRALAAGALPVLVVTSAGDVLGRIVRVGGDHCDVGTQTGVICVAWTAILAVDSRPGP